MYKSFDNLPVVRPATSKPNDFQDYLLKRTKQSAEESEVLDKILEHYEGRIDDKEIT